VSRQRTGMTRLGRYLEGRWLFVLLMVVVATGSAAAQAGGWLLVREAIDEGIAKGDERTLSIVVGIYIVINLVGWLCQVSLIRGLANIGQGIVLGLRRDLFDHLTSLSLRYFSEQRAGWIIARLTSDVDAISDALSQGLPTLVSNIVLLPTTLIVLFIVDWRLALVAMVILPPTLVATRWFQKSSAVAQLEVRNRIAAVTAHVAESVAGMAIVQAFNRERTFQGQFDELNGENRQANVYAQKLFSVFFPTIELLGAVSTCAVLVVGAKFLADGTLTIGTLITAVYLLQLVFQPLQEFSDIYS
jgi:ABC-type multidrug transport system fused ATPase/permease subunit